MYGNAGRGPEEAGEGGEVGVSRADVRDRCIEARTPKRTLFTLLLPLRAPVAAAAVIRSPPTRGRDLHRFTGAAAAAVAARTPRLIASGSSEHETEG